MIIVDSSWQDDAILPAALDGFELLKEGRGIS